MAKCFWFVMFVAMWAICCLCWLCLIRCDVVVVFIRLLSSMLLFLVCWFGCCCFPFVSLLGGLVVLGCYAGGYVGYIDMVSMLAMGVAKLAMLAM